MRSLAVWLFVGSVIASAGCASTMAKLRGESFSGEDSAAASQAATLRPKDSDSKPFGFSNRAREIERNMGI